MHEHRAPTWPRSVVELGEAQRALADAEPPRWRPLAELAFEVSNRPMGELFYNFVDNNASVPN